jgi:NAD-dependent SIR2 family protein deacetylase
VRTRPTLTWTTAGTTLPSTTLPSTTSLDEVVRVVGEGRVAVLSGAGLSTESGIPDYRGPSGKLHRHTPMTYQEFLDSVDARRRYWARSYLGWTTIARARPNDGHRAVAALREAGHLSAVITQNVDGLHHAAGTSDAVELHGSLNRVICLDCRRSSAREDLDLLLRAANPDFGEPRSSEPRSSGPGSGEPGSGEPGSGEPGSGTASAATRINPDGDVELAEDAVRDFRLVGCTACGSDLLKPDVVFFGENVPSPRVSWCYRLVDEANAVLVLGSSLTVMSGLRFVRRAAKAGKPVLIVNQGPTRGDNHAAVRVELPLGQALTTLAARLGCAPSGSSRIPG